MVDHQRRDGATEDSEVVGPSGMPVRARRTGIRRSPASTCVTPCFGERRRGARVPPASPVRADRSCGLRGQQRVAAADQHDQCPAAVLSTVRVAKCVCGSEHVERDQRVTTFRVDAGVAAPRPVAVERPPVAASTTSAPTVTRRRRAARRPSALRGRTRPARRPSRGAAGSRHRQARHGPRRGRGRGDPGAVGERAASVPPARPPTPAQAMVPSPATTTTAIVATPKSLEHDARHGRPRSAPPGLLRPCSSRWRRPPNA